MKNYITYGYRLVDGDMKMNPEQSEAVHFIFDAYTAGVREHIPKRPLVSGEPVPAWYIRDKQTAVWLR